MRIELGDGYFLRDFQRSDVDALARYANDPEVARHLEDRFPHPYSAEDARRWIARVCRQDPVTQFAIASEPELIGGIGLQLREDVYRHTAELGYWLGQPFWNRGIGTRAVQAMAVWGFENLEVVRIQARVFASNPASARLLEKAGFTFEGRLRQSVTKLGVVMDQLVYAILRHELERPTQS